MRRLVVAAILVASVFLLGGCGSSQEQPSSSTPSGTVSAAAVTPAPAASVVPTVSLSQVSQPGTGSPLPSAAQSTPKAILDRLAAHQPMLILFYDPQQSTTDDERSEVQTATAKYRGLIDTLEFDVSAAVPSSTSNSSTAGQVALMTQDLKIGFTPYVVLVDRRGIMTARYRGFVDSGILQREILRATQ